MIPKLVHHIWVGGAPLPEKSRGFIAGVHSLHPNYEFRLWDETNVSLSPPFVRRCYEKKLWAFVSDYLRFQILFEHGGIYLDTDMEVLKSLDPLLDCYGFSGINRQRDAIYCGIIGVVPGHSLIGEILKAYDSLSEDVLPTSPQMFTQVYKETGDFSFRVYPSQAFYPFEEGEAPTYELLAAAYTIHHWDESWRSFVPLRRFLRRLGLTRLYHGATRKKGSIRTNVSF